MGAVRPVRVLVLGGTGNLGAGLVEEACSLGWPVTAVGRRPEPTGVATSLFSSKGAQYVCLDVFDPETDLTPLLKRHDLVVVACEPWATTQTDLVRGVAGTRRLYATAAAAGFTRQKNERRKVPKRIVRIGSPPAEVPLALLRGADGFEEDRFTREELWAHARRDPCWDNFYFGAKVHMARCLTEAVHRGVDAVTAAPTFVVGWAGDSPAEEPLVRIHRFTRRAGLLPAVPTNAVPLDVAARGIFLVGLRGTAGETVQVAGIDTDTFEVNRLSLEPLGVSVRRVPVPRAELEDELRVMQGGSRSMPLLDLWLKPLDWWKRAWLSAFGIEAWEIALALQIGHRSANKIRALSRELPKRLKVLRYPSTDAIREALPQAGRRKAEWLEASGRIRVDS